MFVFKKDYDKLKDEFEDLKRTVFNMSLELETIKEANKEKEPTVYLS